MSKYEDCLKELGRFKNWRKPEIELKELEKGLFKDLSIIREKSRGGSAIIYYHPKLLDQNPSGHMTIHRLSGRKVDIIPKKWFKRQMYDSILYIINALKKEENK